MALVLKGTRALVVGLGKSGLAAARLLHKCGAHISVADDKPRSQLKSILRQLPRGIQWVPSFRKDLELVVVSPGIPSNHRLIRAARTAGVPVWSELELAWRAVAPKKTVAVTGTNGKTTTTALLGHLMKTAGLNTVIGGNIGTPLSTLVPRIGPRTHLVLEVSSYQLEATETFHPDVGLVLNVTPDHLGRHGTMKNYAAAKQKLFQNFTPADTAVLNRNDRWCRDMARGLKSVVRWFPEKRAARLAAHIRLPGPHNRENAMAAAQAALALGIPVAKILKGLSTFRGVAHRLQSVRVANGVTYVNDSKSTNVDSTLVALKSFTQPLILILGGEHKGSPYTPLKPLIKKRVKLILTIGEAAPIIARDLKGAAPIVACGTLNKAVRTARSAAARGDVILLSPACASFDQYENFEERGRHFAALAGGR